MKERRAMLKRRAAMKKRALDTKKQRGYGTSDTSMRGGKLSLKKIGRQIKKGINKPIKQIKKPVRQVQKAPKAIKQAKRTKSDVDRLRERGAQAVQDIRDIREGPIYKAPQRLIKARDSVIDTIRAARDAKDSFMQLKDTLAGGSIMMNDQMNSTYVPKHLNSAQPAMFSADLHGHHVNPLNLPDQIQNLPMHGAYHTYQK